MAASKAQARTTKMRASKMTREMLLASSMLSALTVSAALAQAVTPSGADVVAGQASISGQGSDAVTVTQSTDKAIIDWANFSIGSGGSVQFNNGTGSTLNRVTGTSVSSIDGLLSATGSVYLINPNGVVVGKTGVVHVGGDFAASTLDVTNADFLDGGALTFDGLSKAGVVNLGKLGSLGGNISLVGVSVQNDGEISAKSGSVGLAAGQSILLRDTSIDGGNFAILRGGDDTKAGNTGLIEGATVALRAEGGSVFALAGNTQGIIRATGVSTIDGKVYLTAGDGGDVKVARTTISASKADGDGGDILVTGQTIDVVSDATLNVSTVGQNGDGGTINVIADKVTGSLDFRGSALAKGGAETGNGGQVETSGATLGFTGAIVDASGADQSGNWLLDPYDLNVDAAAATTISNNLATTNVTLSADDGGASGPGAQNPNGSGDININGAITWSSARTLTLDASNKVNINAAVTVKGAGKLDINPYNSADYNLTFGAGGSGFKGRLSFTGAQGGGQALTIGGESYKLIYSIAQLDAIDGLNGIDGTSVTPFGDGTYANYALAADLDAGGTEYGQALVGSFSGYFDGLGHTISNLKITSESSYLGLFGRSRGTLSNIGLVNVAITGGHSSNAVGGLVGANSTYDEEGTPWYQPHTGVFGAFVSGNVSGGDQSSLVGGAIGTNESMAVQDAYASATVVGGTYVGGLIGYTQHDYGGGSRITHVFSNSVVTGKSDVGGLVGYNEGVIVDGHALGKVDVQIVGGGLVGRNSGDIDASDASVQVFGNDNDASFLGGLAGINNRGGAINHSYASGSVQSYSGSAYGGLVGQNAGLIDNSYSSTSLNNNWDAESVGGLVGSNDLGTIYNSHYNYSVVSFGDFYGNSAEHRVTTGALYDGQYKDWLSHSQKLTISSYFSQDSEGNYLLKNAQDLRNVLGFSDQFFSFKMTNDIDLSGARGFFIPYFSGTLDGGAHVVRNIFVDQVNSSGVGFIGELTNSGTVKNISIGSGSIQGAREVGGLVGNNDGKIDHADSNASVKAGRVVESQYGDYGIDGWDVGGLVGYNSGEITNSHAGGTVTQTGTAADAGYVYDAGGAAGGLVGSNAGHVETSYATGSVNLAQLGRYGGGLIGYNQGSATHVYSTGNVSGLSQSSSIGGLIGLQYLGGTLTDGYSTGNVSGFELVGGLVGVNQFSTITDSYSTGNVLGSRDYGGLVGLSFFNSDLKNSGITNSHYNIDQVSINGMHRVTEGGVYGAQFQDWRSQGLSLGIADYFSAPDANGVYSISNINDVKNMLGFSAQSGLKFKLTSDLDFSSAPGLFIPTFYGASLEGQSHEVKNLSIDQLGNRYIGLFGKNSANISNLNILDASIQGQSYVGVLAGHNIGDLTNIYATGSVAGNTNGLRIGGLAGSSDGGALSNVYAGVSVHAGDSSSQIGGLAGYFAGNMTDGQSTGAVYAGSQSAQIGGLVGRSQGSITNVLSTGMVTEGGASSDVGGLVGTSVNGATISNGYYDYQTAGQAEGGQANGSTGLKTSELQGTLPAGFSSSLWGTGAGSYPYLKAFYKAPPTVNQKISGFAYNADGSLAIGGSVGVYSGGSLLGVNVTTGANGYYYYTVAPNLIGSTTSLGATLTLNGATAVSGATYTDAPTLTAGDVTGLDITAGTFLVNTKSTSYSNLQSVLGTTFGTSTYANLVAGLSSASLKVKASSPFTIDQALSRDGYILIQSGDGLTIASGGSVSSTASGDGVVLAADGSFINNGGVNAVSTPNGRWLIYSQAHGNASGAATGDVTGGLGGTSYYGDAFNFSTSTFASTANSGNRFVHGYRPTLTVTPDTKTVTYNGNKQTDGYSIAGYLGSDKAGDALTGGLSGLVTASKNAGQYSITPSGTLVSDQNYAIAYGTGLLTIDPAALTISLTGSTTKVYDGTTTASLNSANFGVAGYIAGDALSVGIPTSGSYGDKNVGSGKTVTAAGFTLGGADAGNYKVNASASGDIGSISKANLTIAAASETKTYDGTVTSKLTPTVTGLAKGDIINGLSQTFDSKDAGSRTLAVGNGYTISDGNNGGNYSVTITSTAGTINKAALVAALIGTTTKTYDGTTTATLTAANYALSGVIGDDSVALNGPTTGTYNNKNAGTGKTVTATGLTLTGADAGNYSVGKASGAIGTISKASLTIAATGDTKVYDGTTNSTATPQVTGLVGTDIVTGLKEVFDSKNAGSRTLTVAGYTISDGNNGGNYSVTITSASGTIDKAALVAALTGTTTKVYDGTTSAVLTAANYTLSGAVSGESVQVNGPTVGAYADKNAGTGKTVTANGLSLSGADAGNYTIASTASGSIGTINKAALVASLTGTATKVYDGTTAANLTASNFALSGAISGDAVQVDAASGTYADRNIGDGKLVTATGWTLTGTDAGNYTVGASASGNIGTITKANLTLAASSDTKSYDGSTTSALAPTTAGLVGGDSVTGLVQSFDSKNAGARVLTVGSGYAVNDGNGGANYSVSVQSASGTIDKASLTATLVGSTTKEYDGTTAASLTSDNYKLSGLMGSDVVTINGVSAGSYANANAGVGKTVTATGLTLGGAEASNYSISGSAVGNIGTISKRGITISAANLSKLFGAPDPIFTYSVTSGSLASGDTLSGALSRTPGDTAGDYDILQGSLQASSNYAVVYVGGLFTILPGVAPGTLTFVPIDPTPPSPGFMSSSFVETPQQDLGQSSTDPNGTSGCSQGAECVGNAPYPGNGNPTPNITFLKAS